MSDRFIRISDRDNVAVALVPLKEGDRILGVTLIEDVPAGHKFALNTISQGEQIIKYGYPIGHALQSVKAGEHVHTHNCKTGLGEALDYTYTPGDLAYKGPDFLKGRTFKGYRRKNGKVGTRNEIWIINTVGCVNKTAEVLCNKAQKEAGDSCDGIFTFAHPYGCSQMGDDHETTRVILSDLVSHPNAGAVLVLGLGCENNNIPEFKKILGDYDRDRIRFLVTQEVDDELEEGLNILRDLMKITAGDKREDCPVSELIVGMKCGGSDGLSGITANPLLGRFSDTLIEAGGSTILTEVPEMFGAETILMNR
ncbi:MAG: UxaA family hydrolase, partial [Spirochaetales bacterium]|nr:UxaA family hydrolase [Spirochaetales bacterium]